MNTLNLLNNFWKPIISQVKLLLKDYPDNTFVVLQIVNYNIQQKDFMLNIKNKQILAFALLCCT